ncbi:MAG: hypothetical protein K2M95_07395, partial [Clostridiales bacterium]|nr:hypothetical protein [Clostridiales bacterium]
NKAFGGKNATTVWPNKPLLSRDEEKVLRDEYAVREDEGVYGKAHYMLKLTVQILALVPVVLCVIWACIYDSANAGMAMMLIFIFIGVLAMRYLKVVPAGFRYPFFAVWGGVPTGMFAAGYAKSTYDPLHIGIAAGVFIVLCTFVLIQFIDVREKNNLEEYSDIVCVKRYLRSVSKHHLKRDDFAAFLPIIYTLPSLRLYKGKFRFCNVPEWFEGDRREL